jgi:hypothetical protein
MAPVDGQKNKLIYINYILIKSLRASAGSDGNIYGIIP